MVGWIWGCRRVPRFVCIWVHFARLICIPGVISIVGHAGVRRFGYGWTALLHKDM